MKNDEKQLAIGEHSHPGYCRVLGGTMAHYHRRSLRCREQQRCIPSAWAREEGMITGVYVQWGTLVLETMLAEEPRAKNWILRDRNGHGIKISYGHYFWRFLPDIRNREYLDWYKDSLTLCGYITNPGFNTSRDALDPQAVKGAR